MQIMAEPQPVCTEEAKRRIILYDVDDDDSGRKRRNNWKKRSTFNTGKRRIKSVFFLEVTVAYTIHCILSYGKF